MFEFMDGSLIFFAVLHFLIGGLLFYTSFPNTRKSHTPDLNMIMSIVILALGVTALVKAEINLLVTILLVTIGFVYIAVDAFLKPFRYRKKVRAMCVRENDERPLYAGRRRYYMKICMIYEYQGVHYREYSKNTVSYPAKSYKNGKEYWIYVRPGKPDDFITRKWGAFFGSFFLFLMVFLYSGVIWKIIEEIMY